MPEIAIIIPHYNDVVRLGRCLCALQENDLSGCEILVVDNGSTQSLTEIQKQFPDIRFVTEAEKGAAAARNRGVQETSAPCLMFIDADCVAAPDWVKVGRAVADKADLIGGRVEVFDETPPAAQRGRGLRGGLRLRLSPLHRSAGILRHRQSDHPPRRVRGCGAISWRRIRRSRLVVSRHRQGIQPDLRGRVSRGPSVTAGLARAQRQMATDHPGNV